MLIKRSENGLILLDGKRRIFNGRWPCFGIPITVNVQDHKDCVRIITRPERGIIAVKVPGANNNGYKITDLSPGIFDLRLRWKEGHTPYPEIEYMKVVVYGIALERTSYPMAPDNYRTAARIKITEDGEIYVNGTKVTAL